MLWQTGLLLLSWTLCVSALTPMREARVVWSVRSNLAGIRIKMTDGFSGVSLAEQVAGDASHVDLYVHHGGTYDPARLEVTGRFTNDSTVEIFNGMISFPWCWSPPNPRCIIDVTSPMPSYREEPNPNSWTYPPGIFGGGLELPTTTPSQPESVTSQSVTSPTDAGLTLPPTVPEATSAARSVKDIIIADLKESLSKMRASYRKGRKMIKKLKKEKAALNDAIDKCSRNMKAISKLTKF